MDNYCNKKLQKRLRELIYSRGFTEVEIAKYLGINIKVWDMLCRGYLKPSNKMMVALGVLLGDEVLNIFLGPYLDKRLTKIIPANEYKPNKVMLDMHKQMREILERGGELKYE
jgi:transcriptional regulator with XRE-family HTH domain